MWHRIEEWGSEHPVMLGGAIFVIGAIIVYLMTRGPSAAPQQGQGQDLSGYYTAQAQATQAGNAYQSQQVQAQAAIAQAQLGLQAVHERVAGDLALGTISSQTALGVAGLEHDTAAGQTAANLQLGTLQSTLSAQTAAGQTAASLQLGTLQSTLSAQVAQAGFDRDTRIVELNAGAATQQALYAANTALGQAGYAAQSAEAGYAAQVAQAMYGSATALGQASYAAQSAEAGYAAQVGVASYAAQSAQAGYAAQVAQAGYAAQSAETASGYAYQTAAAAGYATLSAQALGLVATNPDINRLSVTLPGGQIAAAWDKTPDTWVPLGPSGQNEYARSIAGLL
jgi:hypothetical protein